MVKLRHFLIGLLGLLFLSIFLPSTTVGAVVAVEGCSFAYTDAAGTAVKRTCDNTRLNGTSANGVINAERVDYTLETTAPSGTKCSVTISVFPATSKTEGYATGSVATPFLCAPGLSEKITITTSTVPGGPGPAAGTCEVDSPDCTDNPTTCAVDGVGWIVCQVTEFMADIADGMYGIIAQMFLDVPSLNLDTGDSSNAVYSVWSWIRNIANALVVVAFIIIIYSQMTGLGLTNYGIKKMLPRVVIAVLLINVSYFICAAVIDISNIIGKGIYAQLETIRQYSLSSTDIGWSELAAYILSGGAIALAGGATIAGVVLAVQTLGADLIIPLLGVLLPLLLAAVLAIAIMFFILIARQLLIVALVVLAPLAFIALLLPNTERYFTKWRQWFISLLLLYPICSLLFGMAQIAGRMMIEGALF